MGIRKTRALKTKERILKVAMALFNERGFSNVTVDEIVEKSSTSKGAFYNHFKSKHDIFLEKFKEIDSFYVKELLPKIEQVDSIENSLKLFLFMQMEYIENEIGWDVTRTLYEQELNVERESFFLNPDRPLYQILSCIFQKGQEENVFRQDFTVDEMVTIITRVMRGILYDWSINKGNYSLKVEQENLFAVVIKGLMK
ncbi:TetR/AcrR family transcriptional regulator [Bacillus sp. JJ722]|uniref:TetR/AcrR family transcriptional regulator n=1 Tax=Bacillus sp. JJ722 TaxID=3122973 RepID=UPI002FFE236C